MTPGVLQRNTTASVRLLRMLIQGGIWRALLGQARAPACMRKGQGWGRPARLSHLLALVRVVFGGRSGGGF